MVNMALRQALIDCPSLPSIPAVVQEVIAQAANPETPLPAIVATLNQDPALTARLISLANVVYYSHLQPAETLSEAIERLGMDMTVALAMGFSLSVDSANAEPRGFDLQHFWQRALTSSIAAQELASALQLSDHGTLGTAALLQDIGMLALHAIDAQRYAEVVSRAKSHDDLALEERLAYGADHAEIGAWLTRRWGLSPSCSDWIRYSHDRPVHEEGLEIKECLMLSGRLADIWLAPNGHETVAELEPWLGDERFRSELIGSIQRRLPQMASLFEIRTPHELDPTQLLMEAKQLLVQRNLQLQAQVRQRDEELESARARNSQLDRAVRYDPLTGLYNRQHLINLLDRHFADAEQEDLGLVFLDLDHFKQINDQHGHPLGDEVLKAFAGLLKGMSRQDAHVGRFGGEEFLILLPGRNRDDAAHFAEAICRTLRNGPLLVHEDTPIHVTVSVGVASRLADQCESPDELVHIADQRMYFSKRSGRNRVTLA
ncbi:sensor domain-containing diguanylate cyclase [Modicisalibacter coralii]|uniref:sensor domain-containing diguanylate cyclase n=1 Tax=Modicisalibacter coralii TaxID=2304602 RepID=UPI0013968B0C|nr:diguanylate cyclase [Halomonas coralii]